MPNWGSGCSRAQESRELKKFEKINRRLVEEKRREDAKWKDEYTDALLQKKDDLENRKNEKFLKKAELKKITEEEEKAFVSNKKSVVTSRKVTREEIQKRALVASLTKAQVEDNDIPLVNPNRIWQTEIMKETAAGREVVIASSIDDVLAATSSPTTVHAPERRVHAAYVAYEEEWMPKLRQEFPQLKRSQLKERIWKQFQRAPENPMNQANTPIRSPLA